MSSKLEPSHELLEKVMTVADATAILPLKSKVYLDYWGVHCRVNGLPDGRLLYEVGGKFFTQLQFTLQGDGSVVVRKYKPGDWELVLDPTYTHARFWVGHVKEEEEVAKLLGGARSIDDKISRLKKRVSEKPDNAWIFLGNLYAEAERFKDAEEAYIRAAETWSNVYTTHFYLVGFYLHAIANVKALELTLPLVSQIWSKLTLEDLGYPLERTVQLAKEHAAEALKLAPPKKSAERNFLEGTLSMLKQAELISASVIFRNHPEEVIKTIEQTVATNPDFAEGWSALGEAYLRGGRAKDAEKALLEAVNLVPNDPNFHLGLSLVYRVALGNAKKVSTSRHDIEALTRGLQIPLDSPLRDLPELPAGFSEITLEELACTYKHAREMAELHAKEALRLANNSEMKKAAQNALQDIRIVDQL